MCVGLFVVFFFQAEDGIRVLVRSRGLGDVYKRQIGGGSWGSALGVLLGRNGHRVMMWDLDPDVRADIALHSRNHRYLPHVELPSGVSAADDLGEVVGEADLVVGAVPAAGVELAARSLAPDLETEAVVVSATTGLCPRTGRRSNRRLVRQPKTKGQ